jgi:FKBP-type peptidyl-prolyl cis-trans isomerase
MKYQAKIYLLMMVFLCALASAGCKGETDGSASAPAKQNFDADASYSLGMSVGSSMRNNDMSPDVNAFVKGFKDALGGGKTRFTEEEADEKIQAAFTAIEEKKNEQLQQAETGFLAENSKKTGVTTTASGLQYEVISEGSGLKPSAENTVRVNYEGTLADGTVFDSSYTRNEPAEFPLNGVIPGWIEGIQLMNVGSKYKFYIPSELGYGSRGAGPIPPYSALIFEVELLAIVE